MSGMPLKTAVSDVYPLPSNATANAGFGALWTVLNEMIEKPELDLASAGTIDLGGQLSTKLRITGTTGPITSFGTTYRGPILIRFAGIVTLTHNATTLILPGGANITTTAGGVCIAYPKVTTSGTSDGWVVAFSSDYLKNYIDTADATKAALSGLLTQIFRVANAVGANDAVPLGQADGRYAALAGLVSQIFKVANAVGANDAMPLGQADGRYAGANGNAANVFNVSPAVAGPQAVAFSQVIGVGQNQTDVTASRAINTVYTNSTGKPIVVYIVADSTTFSQCFVNAQMVAQSNAGFFISATLFVPIGGTYQLTGATSITKWIEIK